MLDLKSKYGLGKNGSYRTYGAELLTTGNFETQADFDSWVSTSPSGTQVYEWGGAEAQTLLRTAGDGDVGANFSFAVVLEVGASYEFSAKLEDFTLNPRYWTNGATNLENPPDALLGETLVWVCTVANQSVGIGHGGSLFTLKNISLRKRTDIPLV